MDKDNYFINDSLKDEKGIVVLRNKFNKSYDSMGRQALYIELTNIYERNNQKEKAVEIEIYYGIFLAIYLILY